jgi:hypothetical protein
MKNTTLRHNNEIKSNGVPDSNTRSRAIALLIRDAIVNNRPISFSELQKVDPQTPVDYAGNSSLLQALIGH